MHTRLLLALCFVASLFAQQASIGGVNVDGRWVVAPQYASPAPQVHQPLPPHVYQQLRSPPGAAARHNHGNSVVTSPGGSIYSSGEASAPSAPLIPGVTVHPGYIYGVLGQRGNATSNSENLETTKPATSKYYADHIITGKSTPASIYVGGDRLGSHQSTCSTSIASSLGKTNSNTVDCGKKDPLFLK